MTDATFTVDNKTIQLLVNQLVEEKVNNIVAALAQDPNWLVKVERLITQTVAQETIARVGAIDINTIVKDRVDENLVKFKQGLHGITDQATATQLTITDEHTVVENVLYTKEINVVESATFNNIAVKGSINTDNQSWDLLAQNISEKTLTYLNEEWRTQLVQQMAKQIQDNGINFDDVRVGNKPLISGPELGRSITESHLETVGQLRDLTVTGRTQLAETVTVNARRVGVNTDSPEMALSVWDEEVAVNIGKFKSNLAYIGTSRQQNLAIGVNRTPYLEIDTNGITTIKQLTVGVHSIGHRPEVPGYSGTRGDIVFNSNPQDDQVFAWVCLGAFKWKALKSA